jgi:hypothetical protein
MPVRTRIRPTITVSPAGARGDSRGDSSPGAQPVIPTPRTTSPQNGPITVAGPPHGKERPMRNWNW